MTPIATAVSHNPNPYGAAAELAQQLNGKPVSHILFFCSASYDLDRLGNQLNDQLSAYQLVGCTTAGEITPDGYSQGSITAIGFNPDDFAVSIGFVDDLRVFTLKEAQALVDRLRDECQEAAVAGVKDHSFAITMVDGLSSLEEIFLVTLNSALGATPNFGGSAGDDINLAGTHVFYQGKFHTEAAIVLLITTNFEFEVFSTHHLLHTDQKLIVTEADPAERTVLELNAEPAARVYADSVGIELQQANVEQFAIHPLAVKLGDDYFIRSIQSAEPNGGLKFFCAVETGIVLTLMRPTDLVADLSKHLKQLKTRLGDPLLIIGCDCFYRRMEAQIRGVDQQISEILRTHRVIGLNTYGEQRQGMHLNQTFTGVAIGRRKTTAD